MTVTTVADLDALPVGSVVLSAAGTIGCRYDETRGIVFGDDRCFPWGVLELPLTVLYRPDQPPRTEEQIKAEALREVADILGHATYCQPDPDRDPYRGCDCLISILYARANLLDPEGAAK